MPAAAIEWDAEAAGMRLRKEGRIAGLVIAAVGPRHDPDGDWWMSIYVGPLPTRRSIQAFTDYASEADAKRAAQDILDQYTHMLVTGTTKEAHPHESGLQGRGDTGAG